MLNLNQQENSHWWNIEPEVENENLVCIIWDYVDQWQLLAQVTEEVSDQEHVVLLTSEQQAKEVIDAKKRELKNMEIHEACECVPDIGQKCISIWWVYNGEIPR